MTPEVEAEFVEAVKWLDAKGVEVSERLRSRLVWRAARRGGAGRAAALRGVACRHATPIGATGRFRRPSRRLAASRTSTSPSAHGLEALLAPEALCCSIT